MGRIRAGRADTLAALEAGKLADEPKAPVEEKPAGGEQSPEPEVKPEPEQPAEPEVEEEESEEKPEPVETSTDPEQAKRLATIQAAEKRSREKIEKERAAYKAERADFERERAAFAAERAQMDAFRKATERAKVDPVSLLRAAGVDDFEYAARLAYAESKAATDPTNREAAAQMLRMREQATKVDATEKRIADLEAKLAAKEQETTFESHRSKYLDFAFKAITDEVPIAKALAAKNPAKLRAALWSTAERMIAENDGDVPEVEEIVAAYEVSRRAELEELGVDPATFSATPKKNIQAADKKHPAKTLGTDLSASRAPRPAKSDKEHRSETLAMLESGKLE